MRDKRVPFLLAEELLEVIQKGEAFLVCDT